MNYRHINLEKDKELLVSFRKDTYEIGSESGDHFDAESYLQRMGERIGKFPEGQLIIEDQNIPIGQVGFDTQVYEGERIGYVNLFYIIPEYRGKGIGKELVRYVEEFFKRSAVSEYHLSVSSRNERAIRLYTSIGMTKIKEENDKFRMKKYL